MMRVLLAIMVALSIAFVAIPAGAQPDPTFPENHYLVYNLGSPINYTTPVLSLRDQWGLWYPAPQMVIEKWQNPLLRKNFEDVLWDPFLHHAWYALTQPLPHFESIIVEHQFGTYQLLVYEAVYLLTPADKNDELGDVPLGNHYLCYLAQGTPLEFPVDMEDQWGPSSNIVHDPFCFCNPVEKTLQDGTTYPIVNPDMHLTCYRIDPNSAGIPFFWQDQFSLWSNDAVEECLICLPSLKNPGVPTEESTWGRIKELYSTEEE